MTGKNQKKKLIENVIRIKLSIGLELKSFFMSAYLLCFNCCDCHNIRLQI